MPEPADRSRPVTDTHTQPPSVGSDADETGPAAPRDDPPSMPTFAAPVGAGGVGRLGPYRVLRPLGYGGMGAVYLALDTRLNRKLALKVMLPEYAARPAAKERFLREARAAAGITHDNVVTVYEADERDGVPYIAMQRLHGYPLAEYLRRKGNPTIPQTLRIAREAAAGLAAAHAIGLVHRDIKPGNLWLEAPHGRVKVLDFGLAKPLEAEVELTKHGAVVGTPAYMSPEQGRGEKVDPRSDLFSLGAVLYRLCTGQPPFPGPNTMAILMALATRDPKPVRVLNPEVPESLAALIHQLLAKKPDERPQTAEEVVKRVRAIAEELAAPTAQPAEAPPQVVYVPIQITEQPENSAFADLGATQPEPTPAQPAAAPKPVRRKPGGRWTWIAAGFAALLAAAMLGGVIIIIKNKDGTETRIEVPDGATVKVGPDGKTVVVQPPGGKQPVVDNSPDRKAAEWVLSVGGSVHVNGEGPGIAAVTDLPRQSFRLSAVLLKSNTKVTDAGLAALKDCQHLIHLDLGSTAVTDVGLANFKDCKNLRYLNLSSTAVTDAGLANFKDCNQLTDLDLGNTRVTDTGLAHLKDLTGLTRIVLDGTKVTDAGLEHFKGLTGLTELFLAGTKLTGAGLVHLAGLDRLRFLNLSRTQVSDAALAHLGKLKALAEIWLDGTAVTDAGLAHLKDRKITTHLRLNATGVTDAGLAHLTNLTNLVYLELGGTKVTDAGLEHLGNLKGLGWLTLDGTGVTDGGLGHLKQCTGLTHLYLRKTKVTARGLGEFHAAVPRCKIEHDGGVIEPIDVDRKAAEWALSVGGAVHVNGQQQEIKAAAELPRDRFTLTGVNLTQKPVTDAGLANLKDCKGLTHLWLNSTAVTDAGLANFKDCRGLVFLSLHNTRVTDAGLAHFKDRKNLTFLRISATLITDAGLAHFKDCKDLEFLELDGTAVTDAGLANFKDCNKLTTLHLQGVRVGDAGLATFKECKDLVVLTLRATQVTDAGLAHFKDCNNLVQFDLSNTSVTDAGLVHLKDCTGLTYLTLRKTKVTAKGLAEFHAAVPRCKIEHDGGVIEPIDVDRKAAEWALSIGGQVRLKNGQLIKPGDPLPKEMFLVQQIELSRNPKVTEEGLRNLVGLSAVEYLYLTDTPIGDRELQHLRGLKSLKALVVGLDGIPGRITDAGLAHLSELQNLEQLSLGGHPINGSGLVHLVKLPKLKGLHLVRSPIEDQAVPHLLQMAALRNLAVSRTKLTGPGLKQLAQLKELTTLFVGAPQVTDDVLREFAQLKKLKELSLSGTKLTADGFALLSHFPELEYLDLTATSLSDQSAKVLARLPELRRAYLGFTGLTDAGLPALEKLTQLRLLVITKTRVTKAGVEKLAAALPGCRIEYDGGIIEPKK